MKKQAVAIISASFLLLGVVASCDDSGGTDQADGSVPPGDATPDATNQSADGATDGAADSAADGATVNGFCVVEDYSPCGGDLIGSWQIIEWCPSDPVAAASHCEHPNDDVAACQEEPNGAICEFIRSGTLTFSSDGKIVLDRDNMIINITYFFDAACMNSITPGESHEQACATMDQSAKLSCEFADDLCTCKASINEKDINDIPIGPIEGQFEQVDETSIRTTVEGEPWIEATYCLKGDQLIMDVTPHEDTWQYWVHQRISP